MYFKMMNYCQAIPGIASDRRWSNLPSASYYDRKPLRIGLFGGSFNPPHTGHLYLATQAKKRLQLHAVWWLVTPQNPLKMTDDTLPYAVRMQLTRSLIAGHPGHVALALEKKWHSRSSFETVTRLQHAYPAIEFVWLMGADLLPLLPTWRQWRQFLTTIPIVVVERAGQLKTGLRLKAAILAKKSYTSIQKSARIASALNGGLCVLHLAQHPESSTRLRHLFNHGELPLTTLGIARKKRAPTTKKTTHLTAEALHHAIIASLEDSKAVDIVTVDLAGKSDIADNMVICTATSARHASSTADNIVKALKELGLAGILPEGKSTGDWLIIDAYDVIVHIFRQEVRDRYQLEKMWLPHFDRPSHDEPCT
jgi:nicotinate-nucleotide adenylyltransferase